MGSSVSVRPLGPSPQESRIRSLLGGCLWVFCGEGEGEGGKGGEGEGRESPQGGEGEGNSVAQLDVGPEKVV